MGYDCKISFVYFEICEKVLNRIKAMFEKGKRVTNIGRQKDANEERGYKSQSEAKRKKVICRSVCKLAHA